MRTMNPYLHFEGTAEDAMNFYKAVLGGEVTALQRYKDLPGAEKMSAADQDRLVHITLTVSPEITLMASDSPESTRPDVAKGNNIHICLHTESEKEAEKVFEGLSKNGRVEMPLNRTFWGAYFGMCRDQFGIHWMINYTAEINV